MLTAGQLLQAAVPACCRDDPTLARVLDEGAAEVVLRWVDDRTVGACLPAKLPRLPAVHPATTVLEIAALLGLTSSYLAAVTTATGELAGAVTSDAVLHHMLAGRPALNPSGPRPTATTRTGPASLQA